MRLLLLLLIPAIAQAKTCYFYPACEKKINYRMLKTKTPIAVQFIENECVSWQKFPFGEERPEWLRAQDIPEDMSQPWEQPRVIEVLNVPENRPCQSLRNLVQNHQATETDKEERERLKEESDNDKLRTRAVIKDILKRLDALEGN